MVGPYFFHRRLLDLVRFLYFMFSFYVQVARYLLYRVARHLLRIITELLGHYLIMPFYNFTTLEIIGEIDKIGVGIPGVLNGWISVAEYYNWIVFVLLT